MSRHTPDEDELTAQWIAHVYCNGLHDMGRLDCEENEGEFYAWLAEHDRQVKAEAWDAGWYAYRETFQPNAPFTPLTNPHRKATNE